MQEERSGALALWPTYSISFFSSVLSPRFRHKKSLERFLLRGSKGAVTYSPDFSVPSARRGLTSLFGMGRGGTLVLWPPYSLFFFHSATLCRRYAIKIIDWKQTPFSVKRTSGVISLRSVCLTAVLFPGPPSPHGRGMPFAESFRVISTARLCHC